MDLQVIHEDNDFFFANIFPELTKKQDKFVCIYREIIHPIKYQSHIQSYDAKKSHSFDSKISLIDNDVITFYRVLQSLESSLGKHRLIKI